MANDQAVLLPEDSRFKTALTQERVPSLTEVLTTYAERFNAGRVPQISLAEWKKGAAETSKTLVGSRKKLEQRIARSK